MAFENVSIKNAIAKLKNLQANYDEKLDNALNEIAEKGVKFAKENLQSYEFKSFPSELEQSIKAEKISSRHYQISADGGYATYIEYGSGVVGARNQHPIARERNVVYDRNGHGEKGWVYPKSNGEFGWTKGQPSRPFMYRTVGQLMDIIPSVVIKHLGGE